MSVIEIDLKSPDKLTFVVDLLRSLAFVEWVNVREETNLSPTTEPDGSLFDKFYGSLPNLDVDAFENYLTESRMANYSPVDFSICSV